MKLEHFQYVVAIAECRSLYKAARELFITQPTLSVNLHQLEVELGFQLFDRSPRGMELTEKGREFYQIAKRVMEEMNRVQRLTVPPDEPKEISLAAVPVFCNAAMLSLLGRLNSEASDTVLNIVEASRTDVRLALFNGEASLVVGICIEDEEQQLYEDAALNRITIEPLVHDRMYAYIPHKHPLAHEEGVSLAYLEKDSILMLSDSKGNRPQSDYKNGKYYSFSERDSVMKAISKGFGYAILPGLMAMDNIYVETGLVSVVPLTDGVISTMMYLGYSAAEPLTKREETVTRHIRQLSRNIERDLARLPTVEATPGAQTPSIYY